MALTLTDATENRSRQTVLEPSLVLEIDGVPTLYGAVIIKKFIRIGDPDLFIGDDWVIGGYNEVEDQSDLISLDGTTTQIRQQLLQDKGGTGSVSSMQISLIDKDDEATQLITPGFVVEDIIGRKARVWLSFNDTAFPEDYVIIFQGIIDEVTADASIILNISSGEQKKRQELFTKIQTTLSASIDNAVTTIPLDSIAGFLYPADGTTLRTYVRIDDEIIRYTGINTLTNELTGCTRGEFDTVAAAHDDEAGVDSFYRLTGDAITLALKVMMSGMGGPWQENVEVKSFVRVNPTLDVPNAVVFEEDIAKKYGIVVGDLVTTTGATSGANNVVEQSVSSIQEVEGLFYLVLSGAGLVVETDTAAVASFRSQYDVLGHGVAMGGDEVDVAEFERLSTFFASAIPDYDFYLKESVVAKEFIDTQLLFPACGYSIPRKGRVSVGFTSPPVAIERIPALDSSEITKPNRTQVKRSIGKFFYNTIVYRFEEDTLEAKFLAGRITADADSRNRINVGAKPMTITAKGLRNTGDTVGIIDTNALRFLERYKFAAEVIKASCQYGVGFKIEVGDVVLYGDENLLLPDTRTGTREFAPRLMEVINRSLNIKTGEVELELVDTNYLTSGRYGIFSPSSIVGTGSSMTQIYITNSFGTPDDEIESDKWRDYVGEKIIIHDGKWTYQYEAEIVSVSNTIPNLVTVSSLGYVPIPGDFMDIIPYPPGTDPQEAQLLKTLHCFFDPTVTVVTGVSNFQFTVSAGDALKLFVGAVIIVHHPKFTNVSNETTITDITGVTITVEDDLGFTPATGDLGNLIGFFDGGAAYRWL